MRNNPDEIVIPPLSAAWINVATQNGRDTVDRLITKALRAAADGDKVKRLEACECVACFYVNNVRIAGQAFSNWRCAGCQEVQPMWPNTAVPKVCKTCGPKYQVCVRCVGDLDGRVRKNLLVKGRTSRKRR